MFDSIQDLVKNNEWNLAFEKLPELLIEDFNDNIAILVAKIYTHFDNDEASYSYILKGLEYNYQNYELYLYLGNYYSEKNANLAFLCYENADFYCKNESDKENIHKIKASFCHNHNITVKPVSIVILNYNNLELTKKCIDSIRKHNDKKTYELILVDNHSTDDSILWLKEQKDIVLIQNQENLGFPYACNQGCKAAKPENDIMLLNNDTIIMPNSIYTLRMGLYQSNDIGGTGSVTNCASNQQVVINDYISPDEYLPFAIKNNIPKENPYEQKVWLVGFALLLKRKALDEVGMLDTRFSPGNYEDNDLGLRMQYAGYKMLLCHNSFIFHYGSQSFNTDSEKYHELLIRNREKLIDKWGFDIPYYSFARDEVINLISSERNAVFKVLEIGCGCGSTLARIKFLYPNAVVHGIEIIPEIAKVGANNFNIIQGDIESMVLPYPDNYFDYIIFADVLEHLHHPSKILQKVNRFLCKGGAILASIPNIMHATVITSLLKGYFTYQNAGILDNTHLRFFTLNEIMKLFSENGYDIETISAMTGETYIFEQEKELLEAIFQLPNIAYKQLFEVYQFLILAKK